MQNLVLHALLQSGHTGLKLQWSERTAHPLTNFFLVGVMHPGVAIELWRAFHADEATRPELGSRHDFFNDLQREYGRIGRGRSGHLQKLIAPSVIVNIEPRESRFEGAQLRLRYAKDGSVLFTDTLKSVVPHSYVIG